MAASRCKSSLLMWSACCISFLARPGNLSLCMSGFRTASGNGYELKLREGKPSCVTLFAFLSRAVSSNSSNARLVVFNHETGVK